MRQRNFSRIFKKAEAKEREGIFKITGKGSSKCMEEFRESCPHSDCKAKLGESKGLGCSGIKDNGRGVKVGVLKGSKVNKGMSSRCSNRSSSVSKVRRVCHTLVERRDNRQRREFGRRLLLPDVHVPERWEQMETHYRPFRSEQEIKEKIVQDGGFEISSEIDKTRYVGSKIRPKGCLLPRATTSFDLEVLQIYPKEERKASKVFLQEASFWPNNSAVGLHQNSGSPKEDLETAEYNFCFSRRFSHPGKVQRRGLEAHRL